MSKWEHAEFLAKKPFLVGMATLKLTAEEKAYLEKYGYWLEALANGVLKPISPAQSRFIEVARGNASPQTIAERAWTTYQNFQIRRSQYPDRFDPDYYDDMGSHGQEGFSRDE